MLEKNKMSDSSELYFSATFNLKSHIYYLDKN